MLWSFKRSRTTCAVTSGGFTVKLMKLKLQDLSLAWLGSVPANSKIKFSRYRPVVAQMLGRGIALLFHDRGTRRGWVVSSTPRLHFTPEKDPVPIVQEAGWAPGLVRMGGKSLPHRDSIPDRPTRSQSLYWLSCWATWPTSLPMTQHNIPEGLNS